VDYDRSPNSIGSATIHPLCSVTAITNEAGQTDYPFRWSSTTRANCINGTNAAYLAFGQAIGHMDNTGIDFHGAGGR